MSRCWCWCGKARNIASSWPTRAARSPTGAGETPCFGENGEIIKPRVEGVPAGLLDDREYEEVIFDTRPGDVILLHSDGITDQPNPKGVEYGTNRLARKLQKLCGKSAEALLDHILADVDHHKSDAPPFDDQTLL